MAVLSLCGKRRQGNRGKLNGKPAIPGIFRRRLTDGGGWGVPRVYSGGGAGQRGEEN